jgi:hypothetical protein
MHQITIIGTSDTQYESPRASSHTLDPYTRVLETQSDEVERHKRPRRQSQPKDTYNPSLIKTMFDQRR